MKNLTKIVNEARQYSTPRYILMSVIDGEKTKIEYSIKASDITLDKLTRFFFNTALDDSTLEEWMELDAKEMMKDIQSGLADKQPIVYEGDAGYCVILNSALTKEL